MSESQKSYRSILKASSLIGGASAINILIGMVRVKFVAVLLGTSGVGLMGMYSTIMSFVSSIVEMGISSSGVRQIAEAYGCGDELRLARTAKTLRRVVWFTGGAGMLFMGLFCVPLSWISFKTNSHALPIAILGLAVLLGNIAVGQRCVVQGTRRVADLAKISILGALNGVLIGVPLYWFLGQDGIVPSLVLAAFASLVTSWWFARKVPMKKTSVSWSDSSQEVKQLLQLGVALMGAALIKNTSDYLIRLLVLRETGLSGVGIYQSAFNLSGILVSFVLAAMGADYYPRLTTVAFDNSKVLAVMNDQTEVAVLLALPGIAIMLIFSPILINIFYATEFYQAVEPLRWFSLGLLGRVLSWPIGLIMVARAHGKLFFITELINMIVLCSLSFIAIRAWGVIGAGIAFFMTQFLYLFMVSAVAYYLVGGVWRKSLIWMAIMSTCVITLLMVNAAATQNSLCKWGIALTTLSGCSIFCVKRLVDKTAINIPQIWHSVIDKFK